jgi:hypothetical protein
MHPGCRLLSNGAIGLNSECGTWILEAAKGDNWRQLASDKRHHIATNSLSLFVAFCRSVSSRTFSQRLR